MAKCDLAISIDRDPNGLQPGDRFNGTVTVATDADVRCDALTLELRWLTDGKGREDSERVESWTLYEGQLRTGTRQEFPFATKIPRRGPSSYAGKLLRVDWELRARADVPWAIDAKATLPLVVGNRALAGGDDPEDDEELDADLDLEAEEGEDEPEDEAADGHDAWANGPPALTVRGPSVSTPGWLQKPAVLIPVLFAGVLGFALLLGLWRPVWAMLQALPRLLRGDVGWAEAPPLFFGAIVLVVAAAVGWAVARHWLIQRRLGKVHCEIEPSLARPGSEVRCLVRFTPQASLELSGITARLRATERCERGSGKSRKTYRHVAIEQLAELSPSRAISPGLPYEVRGVLMVPNDAPVSFRSNHNWIEWSVDVAIRMPRYPDWTEETSIWVIP